MVSGGGEGRERGTSWRALHGLFERFLVHGHFDGDVRERGVDDLVLERLLGRVVLRVLMVLSDGPDAERDVLQNLEAEELGQAREASAGGFEQ
jgi:hypothetical protein